ncbi:hypothetical protein A5482_014635 (plasmid) [Cyanobacterium sp. IPPAS B-1200]|uniref:hypothetical protein n=1 Tax=Cyanobacterium sp. IPPAS B-1200 TaxID=1562720 RepID=UPI00086A46A3|nr:hypothetical protein [Cyanobacterium sp. IPPAS B-1200]OEJ77886.1 hypothetical protein A5482_14765 [Cyanobacterium sp. IPPAS B-1200]
MNPIIKTTAKVISLAIMINLGLTTASQSSGIPVRVPTSSNKTCQQSIDAVAEELRRKRAFSPIRIYEYMGTAYEEVHPEIIRRNDHVFKDYPEYPRNRPEAVEFKMVGDENKIFEVMNSPQFIAILASQIMAACPRVGIIYYRYWYEGYRPVAYFSDGTARAFTWVYFDDPRENQWGYYYSP